jgi:glycosyltransferase involved in cell wall biosynthesis
MDGRRCCLISPCRDEGEFLTRTLVSVAAQSLRPTRWIIVDDGSSDRTPELLRAAAREHPWIEVLRREDRGTRRVGPGVVDAFNAGYAIARNSPWDYVLKLDMDLDLPPRYLEALAEKMEADPRLGTASGQPYYVESSSGRLVSEGISPEMSVGASKFYRRRCFEQIGGFVSAVMRDGIDCHRARMLGWKARSFDEPDLRFLHLRPMGSSHKSIAAGRRRHGYGQWFMGTGFAYMAASALYRMTKPPRVRGGLAMWWGYVRSALRREPRLEDPEFRRFLRRYQRRMLFRGKRRATETVEAEQASSWDPARRTRWEADVLAPPGPPATRPGAGPALGPVQGS